ncbi:hypothetical protein [Rhodococcoides corynebacterioides]|uniref:Uncharacterized protein n=1 Tax=Rhodococcoides corynebacterioides TaxID=53972 RepID=A0ABS7P3W6_9NOCA|nr:hypothetical protein [Rhodococcus corynebacterioides]MBY6367114.1 hypothetical protein [Rhodococcus corynebacterioides]MBY6407472.1 hypothetical protein [Rhodococcus corynebacterioides]
MSTPAELPAAPTGRPTLVTVALVAWVVGAVAVVLLGLLSLTFPVSTLRTQILDGGGDASDADGVITILRTVGALFVAVGAGVGFLAGPTCRRGDARFRRALMVLSALAALFLLGSVLIGFAVVPLLATVGALTFVVGSLLVYRPSVAPWFTPAAGEDDAP